MIGGSYLLHIKSDDPIDAGGILNLGLCLCTWQKQAQKKYAHAKHENKPNQAHEAIVSK